MDSLTIVNNIDEYTTKQLFAYGSGHGTAPVLLPGFAIN